MKSKSERIFVPVILGPTAVGKTAISIELAERKGWEILSCDSRQIYKYMDIGTAKPSKPELSRVRHWMIDIIEPSEMYSAYLFARDAMEVIRSAAARGKTLLITGGTGMYFQSLAQGLGPQTEADDAFREHYYRMAELPGGAEKIYEELKIKDPETAAGSHSANLRRNIRALEVFHTTGAPLSQLKTSREAPADMTFSIVALSRDREALYRRINQRVDMMMRDGLWDEFLSMRNRGYTSRSPGMQGVGYRELFGVEQGMYDLETAIELIKRNSRRYAKKQFTWFRNRTGCPELDAATTSIQKIEEILLNRNRQGG